MAKIEQGEGKLIRIDTEKKTLTVQEIRTFGGASPPKESEFTYVMDWEDKEFHAYIGRPIKYILSDGSIVSIDFKR